MTKGNVSTEAVAEVAVAETTTAAEVVAAQEAPAVKAETPVEKAETPKVSEGEETSLLAAEEEAKSDKPEAEAAPEQVVYDFKVPEGTELDTALVESFKPLAAELKMSNADAQKLVDLVASHTQKAVDEMREKEAALVSGWKKEILADPEHKTHIANAKLTLQKFGAENPELKKLTDSWLGSHPGFVKFLAQIGSHLKEANMDSGAVGQGGDQSLGSILYPSMNKK